MFYSCELWVSLKSLDQSSGMDFLTKNISRWGTKFRKKHLKIELKSIRFFLTLWWYWLVKHHWISNFYYMQWAMLWNVLDEGYIEELVHVPKYGRAFAYNLVEEESYRSFWQRNNTLPWETSISWSAGRRSCTCIFLSTH